MTSLGNREVFSENLKRYMAEYELERPDIVRITGKSYSAVNDWYNGVTYPRIDVIEKLANYFGVSKAALIEPPTETTPTKQFLMDKIAKATPDQIRKLDRLWDIIVEEDNHNT